MNRKLLPAYLLTFVNVLGLSILMPVLPFIVEDYGAPEWVYGLLLTFYSAFQFIGSPYLGAMSDRLGRKPVLIISQAGTLFSWFVFLIAIFVPKYQIFGFALPILVIAVSRILDGITGGNTSVANAYVSDITTPEQKKHIFGYLGGISGIGMIIGPAIGGVTAASSMGYSATILVAIGISIFTLIALIFWIKESHPIENRTDSKRQNMMASLFLIRRIREIQASKFIQTIFLMRLLFSIMMAFYISTIALFMIDRFQFDQKELGFFMLGVGIFLGVNQAFVSKWFINKFGPFKTLIIGLSLCTIGLLAITIPQNVPLYFAMYYLLNLGLSLCFPTLNSLIAIHANKEKLGEIMGISESMGAIAMAIFPVVATALYGEFGFTIYYFVLGLPLAALLFGINWKQKLKEEKPELLKEKLVE